MLGTADSAWIAGSSAFRWYTWQYDQNGMHTPTILMQDYALHTTPDLGFRNVSAFQYDQETWLATLETRQNGPAFMHILLAKAGCSYRPLFKEACAAR